MNQMTGARGDGRAFVFIYFNDGLKRGARRGAQRAPPAFTNPSLLQKNLLQNRHRLITVSANRRQPNLACPRCLCSRGMPRWSSSGRGHAGILHLARRRPWSWCGRRGRRSRPAPGPPARRAQGANLRQGTGRSGYSLLCLRRVRQPRIFGPDDPRLQGVPNPWRYPACGAIRLEASRSARGHRPLSLRTRGLTGMSVPSRS